MAKQRTMPVRTKLVKMEGDWDGWEFTGRTNPPIATLDLLQSDKFHDICEALGSIIIDWNFVDEDGLPMPSPAQAKETAIADYRTNQNGTDPDPLSEKVIGNLAATQAAASLPFDLAVAVSSALSKSIASPEKN